MEVSSESIVGMSTPKQGRPHPLERSSYEFIVTLGFASMTELIPNWIFYLCCWGVIAGVGVYLCVGSAATKDYSGWRKFFLSSALLVFLFSVAYSRVKERYAQANIIPPAVSYMHEWGAGNPTVSGTPPILSRPLYAHVTVDGTKLLKYKNKYNLVAILLHVVNYEDFMQKSDLSKSKPQRIREGEMTIYIEPSQTFLFEMEHGAVSDSYFLLAVPKNLGTGDFTTLDEAEDKGAQIIQSGARTETKY
jgi:hypothetical protein